MRIIVLGASGQIGSVIFNGLKNDHSVIGTSRMDANGLLQFNPFKNDWAALGKADVLINCIGQIEATANCSFYNIHVTLTNQILAHREQLGNPKIIQISALGASPNHPVEFLRTKGMADEILFQHSDTVVIRPSIVCTHGTMIVKKMEMLSSLSRYLFGVVPVPKGFLNTRIQPIMPQDLADLVRGMCVAQNEKLIEAVGPEALSFRDLIQMLGKNKVNRIKTIEISKAATDLVVQNILCRLFPEVINSQQYQLLFQDNIADVTPCSKVLRRTPLSTKEFFEREFHQLN